MYKPEFVLENETHEILLDFEIQTDHLIPARRPDLVIINKKRETAELWILTSGRLQSGKQRKRKEISTWALPEK